MPFPPREQRRLDEAEDRAVSRDVGHGRREMRCLRCSTALTGYVAWPGAKQVFILERRVRRHGQPPPIARRLGITSLPRSRASATLLLHITRRHWLIENVLHRTLDSYFGEDACQVRTGCAPLLLSWFRKLGHYLLSRIAEPSVPGAQEWIAANATAAYALLTNPPDY